MWKKEKLEYGDTLRLQHERLGHKNIKYVHNILEKHDKKITDNKNHFFCDSCVIGKQHKQTFKSSKTRYPDGSKSRKDYVKNEKYK